MAIPLGGNQDTANVVSAAVLAAAGDATPWRAFSGRFNLHLAGAFDGVAVIERSMDGGATAVICTDRGQPVQFAGPATEPLEASEADVLYRVRCVSLASGAIQARLSQ